jgi:phage major head subunit gpT-like protein
MAVTSTGLTEAGLKSEFFDAYNAAPNHYLQLATRVPSSLPDEKYRFLGNLPQVREWGTGRSLHGLATESYVAHNRRYELSLEVDADEVADDQTGQIMLRVRELGGVAASHKDYLLGTLLVNGATANYVAYDGQMYFSAAHVSGESGTQSNVLTPAATDADNPTLAEFKAAVQAAIARMMSFKNTKGQSLRLTPTGLKIVVPASMYFVALEAVGATAIAATDNVMKGIAQTMHLPEVTDTDVFYLLKVDDAVRPFVFQDREPLEFEHIGPGSEMFFKRRMHWYGVTARYAIAYGRWQYAIKNTFTAS